MFQPILPSRVVAYDNLMQAITAASLTTNLKLVLDAGDVDSYPGNGQKWLDRSGGGHDFFIGADGSATSSDPTFAGNAGNQSGNEYFSVDGGDYFTYDAAIESWQTALFKTGSASLFAVVYIPSDTTVPLFSTEVSATPGSFGGSIKYAADLNKVVLGYVNSSDANYALLGGAGPDLSASFPGLFVIGVSYTVAADGTYSYVIHVNGTNYSGSAGANASFAPSTSSPTSPPKILSTIGGGEIAPSGSRIYALSVWQGTALSTTNFTTLWNAVRARYGL